MKRIYSITLLLCILVLYFQYGNHKHFMFQIQWEILSRYKGNSLLHPIIIGAALGEIALLASLIISNKKLILAGIVLLGILVVCVSVAGIYSDKMGMFISTVPFLLVSTAFILSYRKLP